MGIFKKIKKGFKKLGSSIAKGMRKIGRGIKKGFGKLTKAFGKLGPLGHLAMFFILPGMGNVLTSWMGKFGSKVMSMLPKGFAKTLGTIGTKIKAGASFITKPLGAVYNTVSKALTAGIDAVTAPFMGGTGAATRFQTFVDNTASKFSATPTTETMSTADIAEAQAEAVSKVTGPKVPLGEEARNARIGEVSPDITKAAEANLKSIQEASKGIANPTYQYNDKTGRYEIFDGNELDKSLAAGKGQTTIKPKTTISVDKKPGVLRTVTDKLTNFKTGLTNVKTGVAGTEILDTGVTIGEAASVASDTSTVVGAYKAYTAEDVYEPSYNPEAFDIAKGMIPVNDPYSISSQATSFVSAQPQNTLNSAAQSYVDALQIKGPDPISLALNAPGYGYTFEESVFGPDYAGNI
jgi:hypothetical protein